MAASVVEIPAENSIQKQVKYTPNARIYPTTSGAAYGLEDDIVLLPQSLLGALRKFLGGGVDAKLIGGEIDSFSATTITTNAGYLLTPTAVYYLEPFNLVPNAASFWGFFELELAAAVDADPAALDFWDEGTEAPFTQSAPQRRLFRMKVFENYETTAAFPALTPGRIKWFDYKRVAVGGSLTSVTTVAKNLYVSESGELILPAPPLTPDAATTRAYVDAQLATFGQPEVAWMRWLAPAATNGGPTTPGSWRNYESDSAATMTLDDPAGAGFLSIASGKMRLLGGHVYELEAACFLGLTQRAQLRLWNSTAGTLAKLGLVVYGYAGPGFSNSVAHLSVRLAPSVDTDYDLEYRTEAADGVGLGQPTGWGENEYARVRVLKLI